MKITREEYGWYSSSTFWRLALRAVGQRELSSLCRCNNFLPRGSKHRANRIETTRFCFSEELVALFKIVWKMLPIVVARVTDYLM